jgi:flavin-dependent dehydrogenase
LESTRRSWSGDAVREIAIPMDKEQFILLINLISKTMDKKESIYSISRGILNRKMIDLAENAGAEFFFEQKNLGCYYLTLRCILEKPRCLGR